MDKENNIEKEINKFLKNFFSTTHNENKILLNNIKKIYVLISFLCNNLEKLDIEFEREKRFKDCKDVNTLPLNPYTDKFTPPYLT